MMIGAVFTLANLMKVLNLLIVLGWILILLVPYWRMTRRLIDHMRLPALITVIYVILAILVLPQIPFTKYSFLGLMEVFSDPLAIALGWIHLLTFNLVAASWMKQDAQKYKIRHRVMVIPYLLTLFLGPVGALVYLMLIAKKRGGKRK